MPIDYSDKKIIITGAGGGIGSAVVRELAGTGAELVLLGRSHSPLADLRRELLGHASNISIIVGDISSSAPRLASDALQAGKNGVDILINCAGMQTFGLAQHEPAADTAQLFATNVIGPIQFANALLPHMLARQSGHIVNIGSTFGSIAFPCFASYSASKFALRGFSEALRRELTGTGVRVNYIAPRYTRTAFNADRVAKMAEALNMHRDYPAEVARQIIDAISNNQAETFLGWPEKLFVRLNALLPRLIDQALGRQVSQMQAFLPAQHHVPENQALERNLT